MEIDSPIGALGGKANGIPSASTTAKLSEVIHLYRPTKVSVALYSNIQKLTTTRSSFVASRRRRLEGHLQEIRLYCLLILTMKEACCSLLKVTIACKFTTLRRGSIIRLCLVKNTAVCTLCLHMLLALLFIQVPRSTVSQSIVSLFGQVSLFNRHYKIPVNARQLLPTLLRRT